MDKTNWPLGIRLLSAQRIILAGTGLLGYKIAAISACLIFRGW